MLYSALFLCTLFSQWSTASAGLPTASTQTYVSDASISLANKNNLLVLGDGTATAGVGKAAVVYYTYSTSTLGFGANDFTKAIFGTTLEPGFTLATGQLGFGNTDKNGAAFLGFGHDVAVADENTFFVSQASKARNTGRVFVYEGNVTDFKGVQLLIPYDGKHRLDSDAFFGESIAAKKDTLAVGCQQCNTTAPVNSGAVYVYKSLTSGWSESQVLTVDDVLFLGEQVAIHNKVLIAAGEDGDHAKSKGCGNLGSPTAVWKNCVDNVADTVVVFEEEGPAKKFQKRQTLQAKSGTRLEGISSVAVFDETIAVSTIGVDSLLTTSTVPDKVYVYYPLTKRYGLETKPGPTQWTQIQVLTASVASLHLKTSPSVSISQNQLKYLTLTDVNPAGYGAEDTLSLAESSRSSLGAKFTTPALTATTFTTASATGYGLTADSNSFFTKNLKTADTYDKAISSGSSNKNIITIALQDQFKDGWGTASLVVEGPGGSLDRYHFQCTTENPQVYLFIPTNPEAGSVYKFRVENGEETPFGWEIHWKVAVNGVWYRGDKKTRLDFIWNDKYDVLEAGASKNALPLLDTCEVCSSTKPEGKHRSLSNLRSLNHKSKTSAPTGSRAPTITTTGNADYWNQFKMLGTGDVTWFSNNYQGAYFWVSNPDGSKLFQTGTSCTQVSSTVAVTCWVELPDGEYKLRVGKSTQNAVADTVHRWKFCHSNRGQSADTEFSFTIKDGECYAGFLINAANKCTNTYKAAYWLKVDILLSGGVAALSHSDAGTLKTGVSETLQSILVSSASSIKLAEQTVTANGLQVSVLAEFESLYDATVLNSLIGANAQLESASNLLKSDLVGSHALSVNFMHGQLSSVSILSVENIDFRDYEKVDESAFKTVADHVWVTPSAEKSSVESNTEYVAYGSFAFVAVAAVLAVSLFVKRATTKTSVVEEVPSVAVVKTASSFKPVVVVESDIEQVESSEESASDQDSESEVVTAPVKQSTRVNLSELPKRQINVAGIKQLVKDEDEVFKSFVKTLK